MERKSVDYKETEEEKLKKRNEIIKMVKELVDRKKAAAKIPEHLLKSGGK